MKTFPQILLAVSCMTTIVILAGAKALSPGQDRAAAPELLQPRELADILADAEGPKPLLIHVGFRVLYEQAHIPGSEYIGPTSTKDVLGRLLKRVEPLARGTYIVIYCGCCPWSDCPNVNPAYRELSGLGFTKVKILYIADNFGKDWVARGFPVAKGE